MSLTIPVTPGSLPQGFCPTDYQDLLNTFSQHQSVLFPDSLSAGLNVSASKPTDTSRPWLQLDAFGRPIRIYWFAAGAWLSLHTLLPGTTIWWFAALPTFSAFDGGDASALSALSGPMWQQAKLPGGATIAAQFPLVAGTLPSGAVLAVGDTGGEENHVLTTPELPSGGIPVSGYTIPTGRFASTAQIVAPQGSTQADPLTTPLPGSTLAGAGMDKGHNTMPVFAVGYLLQRTGRLFYAVP